MRRTILNRLIQIGMFAALAWAGAPLIAPFLPVNRVPLPTREWGNVSPERDRIVVDARDDLTPAQRQTLNSRYGLDLQLNSENADEEELLVSAVAPDREDAVLAGLRKDPLVEAAEPSYTYNMLWTPNDPRFKEQWNLKMIGAEKAWDQKANGKGIIVAVIDTGVAFEDDDHCYRAKDFAGTSFAPGYDFVNHTKHPFDDHGHGTHVSGTIAETTNNGEGAAGLAYEATIMPLKVLDANGSGKSSDIADAIRFAADKGAKVINMSLGSPFPDRVMQLACQYAAKKGVLIVCAAGNSGRSVGYPAAYPECMAVSAVGPTGEIATYSSRGKEIAIAAPGGDIRRSGKPEDGILQNTVLDGERSSDGYYSFQGTSMASPHVAAAAAMVMSRGVTDPAEVRQVLLRSATPRKPEVNYGAGILNVAQSVTKSDSPERQSLALLLFTAALGGALAWTTANYRKIGVSSFPWPFLGFVMGLIGPSALFFWLGFGWPFELILHSALIPLYLLWEAESKLVYRFVSALSAGAALHLAVDALNGSAPFPGILPAHGIPWLWVNVVIGVGVALVAYRRAEASA